MSKEKLARVVGALRGERRQASRRMELEALKQHTLLALLDCADARVERLRECVSVRPDALELWALRPELYVCLSQCFDRGEAARRLNVALSRADRGARRGLSVGGPDGDEAAAPLDRRRSA
jgi:hypothetical protein